MSLTLGEKLQQAREARGISISEVAEQTRISSLYLQAIENNDYRTLPGGIFNKGFVKSYAKQVGIDEQEALHDYSAILSEQGNDINDDPKTYRPEVLTDDQSRFSLLPTILFAVVILGLLTWGIMALLSYFNSTQLPVTANSNKTDNLNMQANSTANGNVNAPPATLTGDMKIEFKTTAPVSLFSVTDGKGATALIMPDKPVAFEPKQNLKLAYAKVLASNVQLTLNGKPIALPSAPANPKRNAIELEITKANAEQIYQGGAITFAASPSPPTTRVSNAPSAVAPPKRTSPPTPRPSPPRN